MGTPEPQPLPCPAPLLLAPPLAGGPGACAACPEVPALGDPLLGLPLLLLPPPPLLLLPLPPLLLLLPPPLLSALLLLLACPLLGDGAGALPEDAPAACWAGCAGAPCGGDPPAATTLDELTGPVGAADAGAGEGKEEEGGVAAAAAGA